VEAVAYGSIATMLYHYAIYPLIVFLGAKFSPSAPYPSTWQPRVTLIIAAFDEEKVIRDKLENSLELDYPDLTILVAADGSADRTLEIASSFSDRGIQVLFEPMRRGKAAALNRAAIQASGEIIVFSDANAMYKSNAIRSLVAGFVDDSVGAVSGVKIVRSRGHGDGGFGRSEGLYWTYENAIRHAESRLGTTVTAVGEILAVRRDVFRLFPAPVVNDDAYLVLSVLSKGLNVRFCSAAIAEEFGSASEVEERARRRRIAAGRWSLLKHVSLLPVRRPFVMAAFFSHKILRLTMPFMLLLSTLSSAALNFFAPARPEYLVLGGAHALLFGAALFGMHQQRGKGALRHFARLCYFLVSMNLGLALGFFDWVSGNASPIWRKAAR